MAKKNSAFRIRVEEDLHQAFVDVCRIEDRPAAQVIRELMRQYIAERDNHRQQPLFQEEQRSA